MATAEMAWGMTLAAQLVVIMGTQYFDGTGAGGTDYPVTDLLQVMTPVMRTFSPSYIACAGVPVDLLLFCC